MAQDWRNRFISCVLSTHPSGEAEEGQENRCGEHPGLPWVCRQISIDKHIDKFCQFFGKPADQLGPEEIRQYQLYLVNEKKASWSSFNQVK